MLCLTRHETDPYFNLAAEEYVMDHFDRDVFMLWRNAPAIIVGRHQNTLAEINLDYVRENNLPVVRRLSGGGAVFHDLGNLNFTFIAGGAKATTATMWTSGASRSRFSTRCGRWVWMPASRAQRPDHRRPQVLGQRRVRPRRAHPPSRHAAILGAHGRRGRRAAARPGQIRRQGGQVGAQPGDQYQRAPARPMTVLEFRDCLMEYVMTETPGAEIMPSRPGTLPPSSTCARRSTPLGSGTSAIRRATTSASGRARRAARWKRRSMWSTALSGMPASMGTSSAGATRANWPRRWPARATARTRCASD